MRWRAVVVGLLALALLAGPTVGAAEARRPASFTHHTGHERDYWLFEPSGSPTPGRPLVVFLHGCTQSAEDVAMGTRWNEVADTLGVVVAYPDQSPAANGARCWNWFEAAHQARGAGEPAIIAGITEEVVRRLRIDRSRVYVAGISAGADMATVLGATYPDVFAAVAPFAGCAYLTCVDVTGVAAHGAQGEHARVVPAMVVQGTADPLNNAAMGETAVRQWIGTNDLGDDGLPNGSVPSVPTSREDVGFDATLVDGVGTVGDPCVRSWRYPCAGALLGLDSYPYSVHRHATADGCSVVDAWYIHGLSHDYPGGDPRGTFTDPIGPAITEATWAFFDQHRLGAPCGGS